MTQLTKLIPHLFTAGNLVGGVLAIIFALTGRLEYAPFCIFISAFLDFFDGFAARLLKVPSELGKQLDSLADMVTFGVAPGVIVYQLIKISLNDNWDYFASGMGANEVALWNKDYLLVVAQDYFPCAWGHTTSESLTYTFLPMIGLLIPILSMFRLAKFNLDTRQTDSFIGVPTPANTLFFAAIPSIIIQCWSTDFHSWQFGIPKYLLNPWLYIVIVPIMSFLLVAELPLFALKFKTFGWKGNEIRYIFLTLCAVMLATLWWMAIPLIIILYILLSLIQNMLKRQKA